MKNTVFEVLTISCCCYGLLIIGRASGQNVIDQNQIINSPLQTTNNLLNRVKRQGGGGFIPFRPLFVYRQQQRERQEKWKEMEAKNKLKEQNQQYENLIKQNQISGHLSPRPSTTVVSYTPAASQLNSYSSFYYPYTGFASYYPSSYNEYQYQKDLYANYYQKYYENYYDGYDSFYDR